MYKNMEIVKTNEMNNLVDVYKTNKENLVVNARDLWRGLGVGKDFSNWIKEILKNVLAEENEDYYTMWVDSAYIQIGEVGNASVQSLVGQGYKKEYILKVDIAKEICMVVGVHKNSTKELQIISRNIRKYFIKCEKTLKHIVNNVLSEEQKLKLAILNAANDIEMSVAVNKLVRYKNSIIDNQKQIIQEKEIKIKKDEPLVKLAIARLDKNGLISITDASKTLNIKKGYITRWAKFYGYIHKTIIETNKAGETYFKVYENNGFKCIGITKQGLELINNHKAQINNQTFLANVCI